MRRDPLERLSIRAALVLGFSLVLGLWLFTGWAFTRQLSDMERQSSDVTARYIRAQDRLSSVRAQMNISSIIMRDALLDPAPESRPHYQRRLEANYAAISVALDEFEPVVAQPEMTEQIARLRGAVGEFRQATLQALRDDQAGTSRFDVLNRFIAPRRVAAIALSDEVRSINRRAFVQHQTATAAIHRDAERRWWWSMGGALAANIGIALIAIFYAGRLEDRVRRQREKDQESTHQLQLLSARLVAAQEEERRSIARELHDEVGQVLSAIKVDLVLAERALERQGVTTHPLEDLQRMTDGALQSVRDLSQLLRPAALDDLGLVAAVDSLLRGLARRHDVQVELVQHGLSNRLAAEIELTAFRVVQEALTNVARHAAATRCTVRLSTHDETLTISIEDDGCGFDPGAGAPGRRGLGLIGLGERVMEQHGQVEVDSAPGCGTRIAVTLPARRRAPASESGEVAVDPAGRTDGLRPRVVHG